MSAAFSPLLQAHPGAALVDDSRSLRPGGVFFAYPGSAGDGRDHIPAAIAVQPAGILWEKEGFAWDSAWTVPNEPHAGLRAIAGELAAEHCGRPSERLSIVAVTGTKGKTTVSWLAAQLLSAAGLPAGYVGTLGIRMPGAAEVELGEHTTPPAPVLQGVMAACADAGGKAAVLEASSQGLDQDRMSATRIAVAAITNIGRDHHDYHGSAEAYASAKRKLFMQEGLQHAIANRDDPVSMQIASAAGLPIVAVGSADADVTYRRISSERGGQRALLLAEGREIEFFLPLIGEFNLANAAMAYACARAAGAKPAQLDDALQDLAPPPGRMQRVPSESCAVYVDYAHTPEALSAALAAVREQQAAAGKLVCVFGCGGNRDAGKRSSMGAAASSADAVYVTSDNPRDEDPAQIAAQAAAGVEAPCRTVLDRREAIREAIAEAGAGGAVLIAGKGHETRMLGAGGTSAPFADCAEAAAALKEMAWA